jgi:hypothetical protein
MPKVNLQRPPLLGPDPKGGPPIPIVGRKVGLDAARGVLEVETWEDVLAATLASWEAQGGCRLTRKKSECPKTAPFNFWDDEALIIFEDDAEAEEGAKVIGSHTSKAEIEHSFLPYLDRPSVEARPSLLVFHVTGHVMLGIYFGNLPTPELHILNPWKVNGTIQMSDVYDLFKESIGPAKARKPIYIDVAGEIEASARGITINLQEDEQVGFCTLWVSIIASRVIPLLKSGQLITAVSKHSAAGSQLSEHAREFYYSGVYAPLIRYVVQAQKAQDPTIGDTWIDFTYYKAATAVKQLALEALNGAKISVKGGKRKSKRRTYRKKPTWRQRHGRRSTRKA